jgi:D-arabinose 1-dehydrogenase-like Zn-dependent alcohol dehydrogenase
MEEDSMNNNGKIVIIGCGGVGAPAAMLSKKLNADAAVTVIREEKRFIVR